ncbi:MAG TPA: hypothetical protein VH107_03945 [Lacipirellulaceae bacterium]|nr:hypothetical protein [Lacipirellulaceae bacterium]
MPRTVGYSTICWRSSLLAAVLAFFAGGISGSLLAPTDARSSESQENAPSGERSEDLATVYRCDHAEQLQRERLQPAVPGKITNIFRVGHAPEVATHVPDGHRLSNGLLAPLTC